MLNVREISCGASMSGEPHQPPFPLLLLHLSYIPPPCSQLLPLSSPTLYPYRLTTSIFTPHLHPHYVLSCPVSSFLLFLSLVPAPYPTFLHPIQLSYYAPDPLDSPSHPPAASCPHLPPPNFCFLNHLS